MVDFAKFYAEKITQDTISEQDPRQSLPQENTVQDRLGLLPDALIKYLQDRATDNKLRDGFTNTTNALVGGAVKSIPDIAQAIMLVPAAQEWLLRRLVGNSDPTIYGKLGDYIGQAGNALESYINPETLNPDRSAANKTAAVVGNFFGPGIAAKPVAAGVKIAPAAEFLLGTPDKLTTIAAGVGGTTTALTGDEDLGQLGGGIAGIGGIATALAKAAITKNLTGEGRIRNAISQGDKQQFQEELNTLEKLSTEVPGTVTLPGQTAIGANIAKSVGHDARVIEAEQANTRAIENAVLGNQTPTGGNLADELTATKPAPVDSFDDINEATKLLEQARTQTAEKQAQLIAEREQRAQNLKTTEKDVEAVFSTEEKGAAQALRNVQKEIEDTNEIGQAMLAEKKQATKAVEAAKKLTEEQALKRVAGNLMPAPLTREQELVITKNAEAARNIANAEMKAGRLTLEGGGRKIPQEFFNGFETAMENIDKTFTSPALKTAMREVFDELNVKTAGKGVTLETLTEFPNALAERLRGKFADTASKAQLTQLKKAAKTYTKAFFEGGLGASQRSAERAALKKDLPNLRTAVDNNALTAEAVRLRGMAQRAEQLGRRKTPLSVQEQRELSQLLSDLEIREKEISALGAVFGPRFLYGERIAKDAIRENLRNLDKLPPEQQKVLRDMLSEGTEARYAARNAAKLTDLQQQAVDLEQKTARKKELARAEKRIDAPETQEKLKTAYSKVERAKQDYGKVKLGKTGREMFGEEAYSAAAASILPKKGDTASQLEDKGAKLARYVQGANDLFKRAKAGETTDAVEHIVGQELLRTFLEQAKANGMAGAENAYKAFTAGAKGMEIADLPKLLQDAFEKELAVNADGLAAAMLWQQGTATTIATVKGFMDELKNRKHAIKEAITEEKEQKTKMLKELSEEYTTLEKQAKEDLKKLKERDAELEKLGKELTALGKTRKANNAKLRDTWDNGLEGSVAKDPIEGIKKLLNGKFGNSVHAAERLMTVLSTDGKKQVSQATQQLLHATMLGDGGTNAEKLKRLSGYLSENLLNKDGREALKVLIGPEDFKALDAAWRLLSAQVTQVKEGERIANRVKIEPVSAYKAANIARALGAIVSAGGYVGGYWMISVAGLAGIAAANKIGKSIEKTSHEFLVKIATDAEFARQFIAYKDKPIDLTSMARMMALAVGGE